MLDETSPYIAGWFAVTVLTLMLLKYVYLGQGLDEQGEAEVRMIKSTVSLISNLILSVAETDSGRYDCLYNGQLVSSFHIAVDSHRLVFV